MVLKVYRAGKSEYPHERKMTAYILKRLKEILEEKAETYYAFVQVRLFCNSKFCISKYKWRDLDILIASQESITILELKNFSHENWQILNTKIHVTCENENGKTHVTINNDEWYVEAKDGGYENPLTYLGKNGEERGVHSWSQQISHYTLVKDVLREYFREKITNYNEKELSDYLNGYVVIPNKSEYKITIINKQDYDESCYFAIKEYVNRIVKKRIITQDNAINEVLLQTVDNKNKIYKLLERDTEFEKFIEYLKSRIGLPIRDFKPNKDVLQEINDVGHWYLTELKSESDDAMKDIEDILSELKKYSDLLNEKIREITKRRG